jgi:hypothetical protein
MITFYSGNLVNQADIVPSSENALFPIGNLLKDARTKVFRSTNNATSIVFDFQESSEIDSVFLVDNWRSGFGITGATLHLNGTNTWGAPAVSQALTLNSSWGLGITDIAPLGSYQFAKLDLVSSLGYCELSKLFIGKKNTVGVRSINFGWQHKSRDLSVQKTNRYGQKFVDIIARQGELSFSFSYLDKTDIESIYSVYEECGISKPFFVQIGNSVMSNNPERYAGMYYFDTEPVVSNPSFGRYSVSMKIEEGK